MQLVVKDKKIATDGEKVEGAIVLTPRKGLHKWGGSVDLNSLYPNTIRSLNISPETLIGQFTKGEEDWHGIWKGDDNNHILVCDDGNEYSGTGPEWQELLSRNKWALSGYGTVFDQSGAPGVLPTILGYWYDTRKKLQAEKKKYGKLYKSESDPIKKEEYRILEELYDLLQLTKKIQLNSLYGALLNASFRFGRKELGASTTGSGRQITTHMMATISQFFTGEYSELIKSIEVDKDGKIQNIYIAPDISPVIYGDTDSAYFAVPATCKDEAVEMADLAASFANDSFPGYMREAFFCQPGFDDLIKAGREAVFERGLFQARKKYILKVVDLEGNACDKLKSQGSEIKKSDTPKIIQKFLTEVLSKILNGVEYPDVEEYVINARDELIKQASNIDIISMGVNKQVNKLDAYYEEWSRLEKTGKKKVNLPGHVRASINFNEMSKHFDGTAGHQIMSGDKVIIFYVKPNEWKFTSISFPAETTKFPTWFLENFTVDTHLTEQKMIDLKLEGIFSAINWEVPDKQSRLTNSLLEF
jgi:DNA polymerase elongation subunit (family B)